MRSLEFKSICIFQFKIWVVLLALSTWKNNFWDIKCLLFFADWAGSRHQRRDLCPPDLTIPTGGLLLDLLPSSSFTVSLPRDSDMAHWWTQHVLGLVASKSPPLASSCPQDVNIICSLPRGVLLGEPVSRGLLGAEYIRLTYPGVKH